MALKSIKSVIDGSFSEEAVKSRPERKKTGFKRLDSVLGGGISPGLIVLGASPGLGKSTFALQLAENIAADGTEVLCFSLEMTAESIAAKFISRRVFKDVKASLAPEELSDRKAMLRRCVTAEGLFSPDASGKLSDRWKLVESAKKEIDGGGIYVIEDADTAEKICETVRRFAESRRGNPPFVIVDYLQILRPDGESLRRRLSDRQVVESNLEKMVEIARSGIPVLLISSLNRSSYAANSLQMDAFKETGGIEYSADVLLGLKFTGNGAEKVDVTAEKNRFPRDVEIVVLKQRYGASGGAVRFNYYAEFDCFEEYSEPRREKREEPSAEAAKSRPPEPEKPQPRADRHAKDRLYINNTKVANEIRKRLAPPGQLCETVVSGRNEMPIVTRYRLSEELSCFDCDVADAVYTLYISGKDSFTLPQLMRALSGDSRQTATEQKKNELRESVERLRRAQIEIDCSEYAAARELIADGHISGALLNASLQPDGSYKFAEGVHPMPLCSYSEMTRRIISFPKILLNAESESGKKLSDTAETLKIKRYLIRRLEVLRNTSSSASNMRIRCIPLPRSRDRGMLSEIGADRERYSSEAVWNAKCRDIAQTVGEILGYYVRIGYIEGFSEKDGVFTVKGKIADPFEL